MARALEGRGIVVTRPREQAGHLAGLIRAEGGRAIVFPALEILDAQDPKPLLAIVDRLADFDLAIFISPTAVAKAMNLIRSRGAFPPGLEVAAIGRGSARELERFGIERAIVPQERFDSEALLALEPLAAVAGKRVVVFRGEGGRELLGETLAARGARVEYAQCYRRARPGGDAQTLLKSWARGEIDAVTVTSGEALRNLYEMMGTPGRQRLRETPVFVPHERILAVAGELGLEHAIGTAPGDDGLMAGLVRHFGAVAPGAA